MHIYTLTTPNTHTHCYNHNQLLTTISTDYSVLGWHVTTTVNMMCSRWRSCTAVLWSTVTRGPTTVLTTSTQLPLCNNNNVILHIYIIMLVTCIVIWTCCFTSRAFSAFFNFWIYSWASFSPRSVHNRTRNFKPTTMQCK